MAPQTKGAEIVYRNILRPILKQHHEKIESIIRDIQGGAMSVAKDMHKQAMSELSKPENLSKIASAATTVQSNMPDVGMALN